MILSGFPEKKIKFKIVYGGCDFMRIRQHIGNVDIDISDARKKRGT